MRGVGDSLSSCLKGGEGNHMCACFDGARATVQTLPGLSFFRAVEAAKKEIHRN